MQLTSLLAILVLLVLAHTDIEARAQGSSQENLGEVEQLQREVELRTVAINELANQLAEFERQQKIGKLNADAKFYDTQVHFYHFEEALRDHTQNILRWQLISSYVLLALVVLVTGLGVILSFLEVRRAIRLPNEAFQANRNSHSLPSKEDEELPATLGNSTATTLELSAQKLQVTSAITGVVILVISLGFLFVFVEKVLELKPTDLTTAHKTREAVSDE